MSPPVIYGFPPKSYKQKGLEPLVEPIPRFMNTHSNCNCYPLKKGLGEEKLSLHPSGYLELTFGGISPSGDVGSIHL